MSRKLFRGMMGLCTCFLALALLLSWRSIGGFRVQSVLSGSMRPAISPGSLILTRSAPRYAAGQVVTFRQPGSARQLVTHRIVRAEDGPIGQVMQTKGDANQLLDAWVITPGYVVGFLVFRLPAAGYLVAWLHRPLGFAGVLLVSFVALVMPELRGMRSAWAHRKEDPAPLG